jgi:formate transporter
MPCKTPRDIVTAVGDMGCAKAGLDTGRLLVLGFLAGAYIAFGGLLAVIVAGGSPGVGATNPGLQKFIFAAVFPVGLMLVIIAGAELFTGNAATCIPAALSRRITWGSVARNWTLSYLGNLAGSLAVAYFLTFLTALLAKDPWLANITGIAEAKVSQDFLVLLLKAVGCNWLVCLAVWLAVSADDVAGKVLGIWFPIMAFVAIGFEHSVANMYFIPAGMLYGAQVTWGQFLLGNLLPVTIGNVIGGTLFVGVVYWYLYEDRARRGKP